MSFYTPPNVGQEKEQPQEPQFQPQWDEQTTRKFTKTLLENKWASESDKEAVRQHAAYYNIPLYEGEFDLIDAFKQAGAGFFEGFTTFNLMEPADNEYEQIFRNLGHLAGFAPGIMATPLNLAHKATKLVAFEALAKTARILNDKSIPMFGAKILTKYAKNIVKPISGVAASARGQAADDVLGFLTGKKAQHIMEGAFHLGAASAISSWQGGVDEMMDAFLGGAVAGGVFRGIGNLPLTGTKEENKIIRGIAGSLFMGLPSTMRGATTPEQVYEYVMGAYFGKGERPYHKVQGQKFMNDVMKRAQEDPKQRISYDPELHPGWPSLDKPTQEYVLRKSKENIGKLELLRLMNKEFVEQGIDPEKLKEIPAEIEGFEVSKEVSETGEPRYVIKKEVKGKFKTVMYSGGAEGADQFWAKELNKKKKTAIIHYTFGEHEWKIADAEGYKEVLKPRDLTKANKMLEIAARQLGKETPTTEYKLNLLRRNWYQIKHAQAVYAVGKIEDGSGKESYKGANDALDPALRNKAVRGGSGWAIEMAKAQKIRPDMPIYVYDQYVKSWYKYNRQTGFFQTLKGLPPKPPREFAGIGTRNLNPAGEAAIKELLAKGYKEGPDTTKKERKEIIKAESQGRAKYRYEIDMVDERILEAEELKSETFRELRELRKNKTNTEEYIEAEQALLRQESIVKQELAELNTRRDEILDAGETPMINIATGKTVAVRKLNQIDSDMSGDGASISKTAYDFVDKNFKELWDTPGLPPTEKIRLKNDYALRLEQEIELNRTFTNENRSDNVIKWALKTLKNNEVPHVLDTEARGIIRQLLARRNLEAQVTLIGADENGIRQITSPTSDIPKTLGGALRQQMEPVKFIEHVYNDITGKINKSIVATLDHITITDKKGRFQDMTIERWRDQLTNEIKFEQKITEEKALEQANSIVNTWKSKIMFQMSKQNYFYFGGRGDADRMFFLKIHPHAKMHMDKKLNSFAKVMKKYGEIGNVNKMRDEFLKQYAVEGGLKINQAEKMFWESATSNLLYDLSMNGFQNLNTIKGFNKAIKTFFDPANDFISNSKAFNKRSQIWFTNGFAGDPTYMKKYVKDLYYTSPRDASISLPPGLLKKFGSAPVVEDTKTPIRKGGKDVVAAQTVYDPKTGKAKYIRINPERLKQLYKEKAWTNPKVEGVDPLPKNAFKTYNEFEAFVIGHEQGHFIHGKGPSRSNKEAYAANENRMNQYGLEAVERYRQQSGQYNYILARDLPKSIQNKMDPNHKDYEPRFAENIKRLSTELGEHVDGMIIVRNDVLSGINRDAGNPILETQNKSFIVSPHAEKGALLGKYMMHEAGEAMTKHMQDKNLHMIVMDSAAKQKGTRKLGDYKVSKKGISLERGTEIYQLDPSHVYYNYSVKNNHEMAKNARVAKQFLGMILDNAKTPFQKELIDDMVNRLLNVRFEGTDLWNKRYDAFINMDNVKKRNAVDALVANIDKISIPRLLDGIREPHNELFAEKAYRYLITKEKEGLREDWNAGELTNEEYNRALLDIDASNTAYDAKIKAARAAAGKGNFFGIFFDKVVRNYREQVIRNFVVRESTKPKVPNSLAARMRPYDKALQKDLDGVNPNLKKANKDDTLFFLDNYYRDNTIIDTGIKSIGRNGRISLGELWAKRNSTELENIDVNQFFNAAVLRVPLDSMSGIQNLKFAGFTGRNGHGIMLHSRVMRALGGADLDGDEAFVYFGGEKTGMKKEWLDIIKANKSEFYETDTKKRGKIILEKWLAGEEIPDLPREIYVGDNKGSEIPADIRKALRLNPKIKTYRDLLTSEENLDEKLKSLLSSRGAMYTITERMRISNAATQGRNLLGQAAVSPKQILALTHSVLTHAPNQRDSYDIKIKGKKYKIVITPRTEAHWRDYARALGRAEVAFSSDPMDELGFKSPSFWFKEMHKAHFNTYIYKVDKKGGLSLARQYTLKNSKQAHLDHKDIEGWHLKQGLFKNMKEIDSVLWGRNWTDNRRWTMNEIREKTNFANGLLPEQQHSFFIEAARKISPLDWTDTALGRADARKLRLLYDTFAGNLEKYPELTNILGRTSLKVLRSPETRAVVKYELYNSDKFLEIVNNVETLKELLDIRVDKLGTFGKKGGFFFGRDLINDAIFSNDPKKYEPARHKILNEILIKGEDFFLNDVNDIGTFYKISELYNSMGKTSRNRVAMIHKFVEDIKDKSYLMAKDRNKTEEFDWNRLSKQQLDIIKEIINKPELKFFKGLLPQVYTKVKRQRSAVYDRNTIDRKIHNFRKNPGTSKKPLRKLTEKENKMLDYLILGTYRRGDLDAILELENSISAKNRTTGVKKLLSYLKSAAAKTSSSRLGWESEAVRDASKAEMVKPIVDTIQETFKPPTQAELDRLNKNVENVKEKAEYDKNQKVFENEMDMEIMYNSGYEGLKNGVEVGPLPKNYRTKLKELIGHLKTQSPHFRQNFNEVVRNLLGKEINTLTLYDYDVLNNWFRDIKQGTWLQRWFSKDKLTELHQRHYWLFPRTINRELMRDGIELMEEKGMFVMKSGKARLGKTQRPTHFIEITRDWITRTHDSAAQTSELMIQGLQNDMLFTNSFQDGEILRQIAVRAREPGYFEWKKAKQGKLSKEDHINAREYQKRYREILEHHGDKLKNKYTIEIDGERREYTGQEIVDKINEKYTKFFKEMHEFITGKLDDKGRIIALEKYRYDWHDRGSQKSPKIDVDAFIRDIYKGWREGKDIVTDIGIDGLRSISRQMMIDMMSEYPEFVKILKNTPPSQTGKIPHEYYFPHLFFNKQAAGAGVKKYLERIYNMELKEFSKDPEIAQKRKEAKMRQLVHKYHSLTGDWTFQEAEEWVNFDVVYQGIGKRKAEAQEKIQWFSDLKKAGSMHSRTNHIPGWSIDATAPEAYARALVNTYHRQLAQIFSRDVMQQMRKSMKGKWSDRQVEAWQKFMHLYVQDALGQPSIIPDSYLKNPDMKLRGTPYAWWSDNNVQKKVNKLMKDFGINQSDLPKEMRGVDVNQLRYWSNLEAQYEMAALLAHPKSMVTNVFGGTMHTVESAGWTNWRNARNIDYLRQNINSKWNSMEDVMQFVVRNGVLPEYLLYEAGLTKEMRQVKNKEFITEVANKLVKDPEMKDTTLREIAAKHGVKDRVVGFAAKFMTIPERHIRRDAFMAHYIQAWNRWGGMIKDPEHPFLIEQAKRGVRATQFLYNAPHRPAFARTALGKVMTRFQLWSWNAVSFRNEVFRQAKMYGFKPGTEAYERYARTMQIDIFVFALANMFAYSLFETALPAPWNWMQDTADWVFGNEKERDRAFFGQWPKQLAPLQMVTPPILRLLPSSMRAMVDDDWSKVGQYYVWTMLPFGRMLRDVAGPGNLIDNPIRIMEKTTGFPLLQLQKKGTELEEEYETGKRKPPPTPGGGFSIFGDDD